NANSTARNVERPWGLKAHTMNASTATAAASAAIKVQMAELARRAASAAATASAANVHQIPPAPGGRSAPRISANMISTKISGSKAATSSTEWYVRGVSRSSAASQ